MKKTIIITIISAFFLSGCAGISSSLRAGEHKSYKDIIVSTHDLEKEYQVLGQVTVKTTNPIFPVSIDDLNKRLRKKIYKEYQDADAVINVKYDTIAFAEGVLDLQTGRSAKGTVVKFVDKKNSSSTIAQKEIITITSGKYPGCDIVFTSDLHKVGADEQELELYCIRKDGSGLRRVTHNNYFEFHADVSPIRQEIVTVTLFEKGSDPYGELDREAELAIWDFNGNLVKRLTNNKRPESVPHWSPDGEKIVFFAGYRPGTLNIYVINRNGTNERKLTNGGYDVDPGFTPDGNVIFSRGNNIMIMSPDGSNLRTLVKLDITPEDPVFIDSETIAFESKTGETGNWGLGDYDIFLINKDGSNLRDISQNSFVDAMPQPVGDKITFWRITDKPGTLLMIIDKGGGSQKSLLTQISNNQMPTGNN